ncbi:MAG: SRPBCC family protein [Bacteroidota bacterium]|nr:SRPBCC family protein [Candidatus Kapabacteria bacterium]MDW8075495.1 SRPBCC family protein [Bacteroidota bacterium]
MNLSPCRVEASDERFIAAPLHRVWHLLRHIERWQGWNPAVRVLKAEPWMYPQRFCWKVSGIRFHSEITAERPPRSLEWKSIARGIVSRRSWMLIPEGTGTRVITHTEMEGTAICVRPEASCRLLQLRTHQMLESLRRAAEGTLDSVRVN